MNTIFYPLKVHNNHSKLYLITNIPRLAKVSLKSVGMISFGFGNSNLFCLYCFLPILTQNFFHLENMTLSYLGIF